MAESATGTHSPRAISTEINSVVRIGHSVREPVVSVVAPDQIGNGMLASLGFKVPNDIGLATLNTLDGNVDAGIDQNPERIGRAAVEVLIALLNRNEQGPSPDYRTTTVMGKWRDGACLPRKSSEPVRAAKLAV